MYGQRLFVLTRDADLPAKTTAAPAVALLPDRETGWSLIRLRLVDASGIQEAAIAPAAGSNLFSWSVDGEELLLQPARLWDLREHHAGTPIMFPTVNRVRDSRMSFEGRDFVFEPNLGSNFIHGLARHCRFEVTALYTTADAAVAETTLDWNATQPAFARFPIRHRLTLRYHLDASGMRIGYRVENLDDARLPYGFGLHPYFRVPGRREDVTIAAPLDAHMEADAWLPTGAILPVEATAFDLRRGATLSALNLDEAYVGMAPGKAASFALGPGKLTVQLSGSEQFTHLVVYTPADRGYFCIENQTSSTDAHNLWARGKTAESHLLVVGPGQTDAGEVHWAIVRG
ncbi:MAG TPA: aldose 1-epimerase [Polyangia bacterium]